MLAMNQHVPNVARHTSGQAKWQVLTTTDAVGNTTGLAHKGAVK